MPEHKQVKIASETLYIYAPMEIAIVAGEDGINAVLEESESCPVKLLQPIHDDAGCEDHG